MTIRRLLTPLIVLGLIAGSHRAGGQQPREGYVNVEGGRVWYRVVGSGSRTPLLLLHGGPGFPSDYLEPLARLADERPVIFYDQLGSGRSDRPANPGLWRVDRFVAELPRLRAALGLKEVHVLGHSWGSMLAVDYLLTRPAGVRSAVLASPCLSVTRWLADAQALKKTLPQSLHAVMARHERAGSYGAPEYQAAVIEYYRRFLSRRDPWPAAVTKSLADLNLSLYVTMWGPNEFTPTGVLRNYERTERLRELNLPVLFTAGRYDEATPASVEHYRGFVRGARVRIFEDSAHLTMNDEPEAYVQAVREFLREVEQP
jgi:proline iminopeptidase